jgi:serine/threonine-protein kinase
VAFFCINCKSETSPDFKACPFCGEPITDFLRRYLEQPFDGKYKIVSRLGIGGMGEVYKVLHLHLNALRVVKLMRASVSNEEGAHDRFLREARLATRINHPNVSTLFDFSTLADGTHYMVWEYIEGMTIAELLRVRGALPPRYVVDLAIQALAGLEAIHRSGVVHRDVSPENIMITRDEEGDERVKIIDLGIAKQSSESTGAHTKAGMFVGKWKYCSPEQLGMLKEGETIDRRADLYSFAIVLYEMLSGSAPFTADSPHRYLLMHATETPRPLSELRPSLGKASELEALIFRALEKDRERRFATARQFAAALEAVRSQLEELPVDVASPQSGTEEETIEQSLLAPTQMTNAPREIVEAEPTVTSARPPLGPSTLMEATFVGAQPTLMEEPAPVDVEATRIDVLPTLNEPAAASPRGVGERVLVSSNTTAEELEPARRSQAWLLIAALLIVSAAVLYFVLRGRDSQTTTVVQPATSTAAQLPTETAPVVPVKASIAVNSFPWSEVASVKNVDSGANVALDHVITPARIDVAAGTYDVTLRRSSGETLTRRVVVSTAGADLNVQFNGAGGELPSFGGTP